MSTILRALKQVEKQGPDQGDENNASSKVRIALSSRIQQQKQGVSLNRLRMVTFAVMIVGLGIIAYFFYLKNTDRHFPMPDNDQRLQVLDTPPDRLNDQKQAVGQSRAQSTKSTVPLETSADIPPKSDTRSFDLPILPNEPVGKLIKRDPVQPGEVLEIVPEPTAVKELDTPGLSPPKNEKPISDEAEKTNRDAAEREILPLENNGLRIQAISWAKEPEGRIAVIDNKILNEGDSVQGYRLVTIEEDAVILNYSGRLYRLEFKYR